jgi:hypothetical protein
LTPTYFVLAFDRHAYARVDALTYGAVASLVGEDLETERSVLVDRHQSTTAMKRNVLRLLMAEPV